MNFCFVPYIVPVAKLPPPSIVSGHLLKRKEIKKKEEMRRKERRRENREDDNGREDKKQNWLVDVLRLSKHEDVIK